MLSFFSNSKIEAGCDEAGRGCLAGPVFAAAVILNIDFHHPLLNDSKKVSPKNREILRQYIIQNSIAWSVAIVDNKEIDRINILNASILAMHKALDLLSVTPEIIVVDGNRFKPYKNIEFFTVVGGDAKITSIAAASILAKTFRDDFMTQQHSNYPIYNWIQNKGYPTAQHIQAVNQNGLTPLHRKSFCQFYSQKNINYEELQNFLFVFICF